MQGDLRQLCGGCGIGIDGIFDLRQQHRAHAVGLGELGIGLLLLGVERIHVGGLVLSGLDIGLQRCGGPVERNGGRQVSPGHTGNQYQHRNGDGQCDARAKGEPGVSRSLACAHSSLLDVAIHAPNSHVNSTASAIASGQTTAVVRVRFLVVTVVRHCFEALADT